MKIFPKLRRRHNSENGLELSEYAVGLALIVIAVIAAFTNLGSGIARKIDKLTGIQPVEVSQASLVATVAKRVTKDDCVPTQARILPSKDSTKYDQMLQVTCNKPRTLFYGVPRGKGVAEAVLLSVE